MPRVVFPGRPLVSSFSHVFAQVKLLDMFPNAALAFSIRKLRTAYAGSALRIRRDSDNTEQDIGFDANGNLDTASANSFIGNGRGFITKWYDQSGSGLLTSVPWFSQATANNQPVYVAIGIKSLPSISWISATSRLNAEVGFNLQTYSPNSQPNVFIVLNRFGSSPGTNGLFGFVGTTTQNASQDTGGTIFYDVATTGASGRISVSDPSVWADSAHVLEMYRDTSNTQGITTDGVSQVSATRTDTFANETTNVGVLGSAGGTGITGQISEMVFWGQDIGASNRAYARHFIAQYFGLNVS